jgi:hypothetical protein
MPLSGPQWVSKFPASTSLDDLADPFRGSAKRFVAALTTAHATVIISDTLRPPQRAHLMHFSFAIARESLNPASVPPMPAVDIHWVHTNAMGQPDLTASRAAAEAMVQGYGIAFKPVLNSHHTEGRALDMTIWWKNKLVIAKADGTRQTIASLPRTGAGNTDLHLVGLGYGVRKLVNDPPHWSSDGH